MYAMYFIAGLTLFVCLCHRYAITVWYFDANERAKAKEKYKLGESENP